MFAIKGTKMTIAELLECLDGNGLIITDYEELERTLQELKLHFEDRLPDLPK